MRLSSLVHVSVGALCWTIVLSSIILLNLYEHPLLDSISLVLVFFVSFFAGFVIGNVRYAVICWLVVLLASMFITFFILSLPLLLGLVPHSVLSGEFYAGVIVMIFRAVFPAVLVICFLACIFGAIFSEKVNF
jgi:hypothetical protein